MRVLPRSFRNVGTQRHIPEDSKTTQREPQISYKLNLRFTNNTDTCVIVEKRIPNAGNVKRVTEPFQAHWFLYLPRPLKLKQISTSCTSSEVVCTDICNKYWVLETLLICKNGLPGSFGTVQPVSALFTEHVCAFDVGSYRQAASRKT